MLYLLCAFARAALSHMSRRVAKSLKIKMKREERIQQQKQKQQGEKAKGEVFKFQPLDSTAPQQVSKQCRYSEFAVKSEVLRLG